MSTTQTTPAQAPATKPGRARAKPEAAGGSRIGRATRAGAAHIAGNPFAAVVGAAAVSAGIALLLPASRREAEVMGDVADRIGDLARDAADRVVEAGRSEVEAVAQTALAGVGGALLEKVLEGELPKAS